MLRPGQRRTRNRSHRVTSAAVLAVAAAAACATSVAASRAIAQVAAAPDGWLFSVAKSGAGIAVAGWAVPTDRSSTAFVRIAIDGERAGRLAANQPYPQLLSTHPEYGSSRGFRGTFPATAGRHRVCAFVVLDPAVAGMTPLNCRTITLAFDPTGAVDPVTAKAGSVTVSGWAVDPDAPTSGEVVRLRVDRRVVASQRATLPRADVSVPGAGPYHGYSFTVPIGEGTHAFCVRAINVGPGVSTSLTCTRDTVSFSPTVALTAVARRPSSVFLRGWAVDPDTAAPVSVVLTADGRRLGSLRAAGPSAVVPHHGFAGTFRPANTFRGWHRVCVVARNLGAYGEDTGPQCVTKWLNWDAHAHIDSLAQRAPGALVTGWARDPDVSGPVQVVLTGDGTPLARVTADGAKGSHPGHTFSAVIPLGDGRHTVCASAVNVRAGDTAAKPSCATIALAFAPYGRFEQLAWSKPRRGTGTSLTATGWAIDPDTSAPIQVAASLDSGPWHSYTADLRRPDVAATHPRAGPRHGFAITSPAPDGEHTVCVRALNVGAGDHPFTLLGCQSVIAAHPSPPGPVTGVAATAGYGGATVTWTPPTDDGGAPVARYRVTPTPSGPPVIVTAPTATATLSGLRPDTLYQFSVVAINAAGNSPPAVSPAVRTPPGPPPQTTPAPVSTSRYIRNITGAGASNLAVMRAEGAADAAANPSGHGYLVLLDIGGQDETRQGVILSAGIRFVSYRDLVRCLNAYVDGYASRQRGSAPVIIALGTNNDIDVSRSSGESWATHVVAPVRQHAGAYPGLVVAGADDIEPGFRAGYAASAAWLSGFLASTRAPFVFNGSADGCSWTTTNAGCNNGWTMRNLQWLAGGADPIRIINLPQIYNTTMAAQWRYISLTGVYNGQPKLTFGGPLTEYTACRQDGSCGSLRAQDAWNALWRQLNAQPQLKPRTLPYSTDLRIDS